MKNKPLLNESTVRKFMKLANMGRVGQGFIAENYGAEEEEEGDLGETKHKRREEEEEEDDEGVTEGKKGGNSYNAFKGMKKQEYKPEIGRAHV